jgi:2-polyprenyl-3-methyl-5-hydroxy-6-metoxy-1,4-benzoquinol methylase
MTKVLSRWIDYIVSTPLRRFLQNPRRVVGGYVKSGMTVLDVGCGKGYFCLGMAKMVGPNGRVFCVDVREDAIQSLKTRADNIKLSKRIDARMCSQDNLGINDLIGQVDFALAFYVVHHAQNASQFMAQLNTALKAGGKFLIVEPRHHASVRECEATEARAREAGFTFVDNPKLAWDWAAMFVKI